MSSDNHSSSTKSRKSNIDGTENKSAKKRKTEDCFAWLLEQQTWGTCVGGASSEAIQRLKDSARELGVDLPLSFVDFLYRPELLSHLPAPSADFLNIEPLVSFQEEGNNNYFARFLSDQQGCGYWYLVLLEQEDKSWEHCVVASLECWNAETSMRDMELERQRWGSFEIFLRDYWADNYISAREVMCDELVGSEDEDSE